MLLALLVFGGGLAYWCGLVTNQRTALITGGAVLAISLGIMLSDEGIDPRAIPFLAFTALLAFTLKRAPQGIWPSVGWAVFITVVLALGFRVIPCFEPVETVPTAEHLYRFPPEKGVLMLLVPPMILVPWSSQKADKPSGRPWLMSLFILAGILAAVVPLALITGFVRPGLTTLSMPYLVYWLIYNLIYTCVLEESFFRGILQNALIRGFNRTLAPATARAAGIAVAAVFFGLAHFGGGTTYVALATLAGVGYGLAYELTGRLHHAVLVHFGVNAMYLLVFSWA